jgi:transposase
MRGMSDANLKPQDLGISEADWQQTPASVRAVLGVMHQRLSKLEEQLQLNSDNSSQPPASDKPRHQREKKGKLPSDRKRGGQPGHKGQSRPMVSPEAVSEFRGVQAGSLRSLWRNLEWRRPGTLPLAGD